MNIIIGFIGLCAAALLIYYGYIVDGRGALCGIITRQSLIHYFENQSNA
jgi:hypothetical protein